MTFGDPMNTTGGIVAKNPLLWLSVPPGLLPTPYDTTEIVREYDGIADWPDRFNPLAATNAVMGVAFVHPDYGAAADPSTPGTLKTVTVNAAGGTTTHYVIPTADLPITAPLRIAGIDTTVADKWLRPYIDSAYVRRPPKSFPTPPPRNLHLHRRRRWQALLCRPPTRQPPRHPQYPFPPNGFRQPALIPTSGPVRPTSLYGRGSTNPPRWPKIVAPARADHRNACGRRRSVGSPAGASPASPVGGRSDTARDVTGTDSTPTAASSRSASTISAEVQEHRRSGSDSSAADKTAGTAEKPVHAAGEPGAD